MSPGEPEQDLGCKCYCVRGRRKGVKNGTHAAVKHDAVAVAHGLYVGCQVEADRSVADGVHRLSVKEVVGPRWWERRNWDEKR